MRRWTAVSIAFALGLAITVVAFVRGGGVLACTVSGEAHCGLPPAAAQELLYAGLALVAVAVLTAVVTVARRG